MSTKLKITPNIPINDIRPYEIVFVDDTYDESYNEYFFKDHKGVLRSIITGEKVDCYFEHNIDKLSEFVYPIVTKSDINRMNNNLFKNEFICSAIGYGELPRPSKSKGLYLLAVRYTYKVNNKLVTKVRHHLGFVSSRESDIGWSVIISSNENITPLMKRKCIILRWLKVGKCNYVEV